MINYFLSKLKKDDGGESGIDLGRIDIFKMLLCPISNMANFVNLFVIWVTVSIKGFELAICC